MCNYPYHYQSGRALDLAAYRAVRLVLLDYIAARKHSSGDERFNYDVARDGLVKTRHAYYVLSSGRK